MNGKICGARLAAAALGLSFVLTLGACGQSGPLYLPGNPSQIQVEAPDAPADRENGDESDDDEREQR